MRLALGALLLEVPGLLVGERRLAAILRAPRGKSVLSINDTPEVRAIFANLHQLPIETTYAIGTKHGGAKRVGELLISNFALPV